MCTLHNMTNKGVQASLYVGHDASMEDIFLKLKKIEFQDLVLCSTHTKEVATFNATACDT